MKPLDGIKVIDLTQYIAGPYCTMLLETFGAEVVKIETEKGDDARSWPPIRDGFSGYFANYNCGKKSVCLDIKTPEGRAQLDRLIAKSDVLVHNFIGHTKEKLNMGYEIIAANNPKIIYCGISGWGATGPYKDRKGFDTVFQAVAGITGLTGEKGGDPIKAGVPIGDVSGGLYAALSIMAAIRNRDLTGNGENIDLSMVEGLYNFLPVSMAFYSFNGHTPERLGSGHVGRVPSQVFKCGDGKFVHISLNDGQWGKFCMLMGMDDWAQDEFYKVGLNRVKSRDVVVGRITEILNTMTRDELSKRCFEAGVPCGEVNLIEDIIDDPQCKYRDAIEQQQYQNVTMNFVNYPAKFINFDTKINRKIPSIGEHNKEVFDNWLYE